MWSVGLHVFMVYKWFPTAHFILKIALLASHDAWRLIRGDTVALSLRFAALECAFEWTSPNLVISSPVGERLCCFRVFATIHSAAVGCPICGWKFLSVSMRTCHPGRGSHILDFSRDGCCSRSCGVSFSSSQTPSTPPRSPFSKPTSGEQTVPRFGFNWRFPMTVQ